MSELFTVDPLYVQSLTSGEDAGDASERLQAALALLWADLASRAAADGFQEQLMQLFGASEEAAADLAGRLAAGDMLGLRVELLSAEAADAVVLLGDDGRPTIRLAAEWLTTASEAALQQVLLERIGQAAGLLLNGSAASGEGTGEGFAALLAPTETNDTLKAAVAAVWAELASRAPEASFRELLMQVFGASAAAATALADRLAAGDKLGLRFELASGEEMGGARGAFAAVGDDGVPTVYINEVWMATASADALRLVLLEETSHSFDPLLNGSTDTAGDEGELFADLFSGVALTPEQLAAIRSEDDSATLTIDGQAVAVEMAISYVTNSFRVTDKDANISDPDATDLTVSNANASGIVLTGTYNKTSSSSESLYLYRKLTSAAKTTWQSLGTLVTAGTAGNGLSWSFDDTPAAGSYDYLITTVSAVSSVNSASGNTGTAPTVAGVIVDNAAPTLAITSNVSALKIGETATITFTFSEVPTGFTASDITTTGGLVSGLAVSGTDSKVYTATFTPTANTNGGTASITVSSGSYTDAAGNNGGAGSTPSLTFDTLAPTLAITSNVSALKIGETATITFTFSEVPTGFTASDITTTGGLVSGLAVSGTDSKVYTATFTPTANTNGGTASITVSSGSYTDAAGNNGGAGSTPSLTFDTLAPTLAITSNVSALKIGETATITFTFSEVPTGFTASDITTTGGLVSGLAVSGTDSKVYTATFTPIANTNGGTASITVSSGSYTDAAGNNGGAGSTPSLTFDTLAPSVGAVSFVTISEGLLDSAPNAVTNQSSGTIVFVYSGADLGAGEAFQYSLNGGSSWLTTNLMVNTDTNRVSISGLDLMGSPTVSLRAIDAAGNTTSLESQLISYDGTAPSVTVGAQSTPLVEAGGNGNGTPGQSTTTITLTPADAAGTTSYDQADLLSKGWITSDGGLTYSKAGIYGSATLTLGNGVVSYELNNIDADTQGLTAGQQLLDGFGAVRVLDAAGNSTTSGEITVTITGSNDVATITSASAGLTETNAVLSTGGSLSLTDLDATAASVVAQGETAGTYGKFSIDASGVWSYATNDAVNQLNAGEVVTEIFSVSTTDGGSASVTVTITGSNDVATITSASAGLTETNAVLSTGGSLSLTDLDATAASVVAQGETAGTYGKFSIDASGVWSYATNDAVNQLNAGEVVTEIFSVSTTDGGSASVTVTITGSNDVATITSASAGLTETNAVLSTGGSLSLTDLDATAASVVAQGETAGTYGKFSIDASGVWSYATNDAVNQLNAGEVVTEIFSVSTTDGGSASVTVTITGSNDVATITSASAGLTETNAVLSTGGSLSLTDLDATAASVVAQGETAGTYGKFSIDASGVWSYATNDAVNQLNAGEVVTEIFSVSTTDGGSASVTVTITGSNDVATITSASAGLTETNAVLSTGGSLSLTDLDATAASVVAQGETAGTYGKFSIDASGVWSYATNDAVNQLNAGEVVTEIFSVSTTDGGSASVTVTITGSNDVATITSASAGLTETNAVLSTGGSLSLTDLDATAASVVAQGETAGTYGKFSIDASGVWSYATNDAVNQLNAGEVVTEIFSVSTTDGGSASVTVTITGSNDVATITSASAGLTETNAVLSTGGSLSLTDLDATAASVVAQGETAGTYGKFSIDASGVWSYATNDAVNQLNAGEVVTEIFSVSTTDGGSASVTVTITGSNDVATITSASAGLTETNAVLSTGGSLSLTDLDATAASVVAQGETAGTYGKFSIDASGVWSYATNDAVNQLNAGEVVTEIFSVSTTDGGSASVTVTITGSNDVATITSASAGLTETNAVLSTGGSLSLTDLDATAASVVAQGETAGTYGKFSIDASGVWSYATNDAVNQLNAGEVVTEIFSVSTTDGGSASVTVTITGSNDVATITSASAGLTETNAVLSTGGSLSLTDLDATAASVVAQGETAGTYGKFSIDASGVWSYATNDAVNQLNAGEVVTEIFSVSTTDGGSASVTVTITGSNDVATITSASAGLTETNAVLSTGGSLSLTDLDATAASVVAQGETAGTYGKFSIDASGVWSYATNDAVNQLNAGEVVTEIFSVSTTDGGSASVTVTITGSNDVATITSASAGLTETNAVLSTGGSLSLTDLDATAASVVAQGETAGTYGKFSIDASGVWSYATNDAVNQLNAGEVVTEIFSVSTTDGGSASVTVTITGSNDVATITSASAGLTETNAVLSTGGSLSLTDLDATAASVVAQGETAGTYGKFSIDASGVWSYATNDAVNQLNAGEVVTEIFSVSTTDGGSASVTVTITGSNDVATITSASAGLTETNAVLSTGGSLSLTDLDATAASVVAQGETAGTYGKFSIDASGVWSYATNDAVNQLNAGEVVTEIFSVSTTDGGSASVTVTITGSNDVATITSASAGLTETNAVLSTGGSLSLTDLDATAASVVAQGETAGTYGKFSIDASGVWSYATNDAVNQLNAGEVVTEIFSVSTTDGGSASVTVTITGSNDVATITSASAGLTETNAVLSTGGSLSLTDLDATAASVVAQGETAGTYGKFSIDASGVWSYATNDAVNQLNAGEVVTEIFSVSTTDGGSASVTVTITGSNDVATITSASAGLTETNAVLSTGGSLSLTDLDATAASVVAQGETAGTYGKFSIDASGVWSYATNDAVNQLNAGEVVTEIFSVSTTDGGSASVTVTITGSNDVATITSASAGLTETNAVLSTGGSLSLTDLDATAASVVAQGETAGTYGKFSIDASGVWSYATNDAVNQLNAGEVVTEIFSVSTTDGGSASVTVTITGSNDVATITSASAGLTETNAVLSTGGSLSLTDLDATAASVVAQGETAGTYGKFSIDASGVWSYATNDAVNQLNAGEVVTEIFSVSTTDGGSASVTVTITGSNDVATITSASAGLTETNAVLSTGGSLSLTDLDATAASVVAQGETAGTYGKFSIDASGVWSYATNDAVNQLNAGEVVTEIFSVSTTDGGSASVTVTITGSNDVATITSASAGLTETNAVLSTGGSLSLTDLDATAASVVAQGETAGTYGKFSIDASGVWSYATNDAVNQLNAGEVVTEIFSVSTTDGGSASVTVTITGSNDVATITSASAGLTETNAVLSTGGSLSLTDLDATAASVVAQGETAGTYGKFSIDASGVWSYATNDAVNQLNAGEVVTEIFSVSTTDGGSASVTVTITGSNDVATITSASAGLTETNAVLSTGGSLSLTDLDATAASVVAQGETAGTYGKFSIDASGVWSYATNDAVNQLNAGEVVTEIFSVSTTDGGSASVTVTITGSNDVATITSASAGLTETNAVLSTGGSLSLTDLDATAASVVAQGETAGTYGKFSIDASGVWSYATNDAVNQLNAGEVVTEIFSVSTTDGGSASVTVTITGSNDVATITSASAGLTETNAVLSTGGSLSLTDLDATAASVVAQGETAGTYGKFSIDASGVWSYATNDAVNQLNAGEVVTEIFSVSTTDGGSASVTVTITGSNDVATITSASAGLTETNAVLSTGGSLSLTDLDATAASVVAQGETAGTYGKFSIDASGVWSYATNDAVNQLNAGEVVTEIFSVSTTDGGSASVTVTITGSNDVATITSASAGLTETNAVLSTGGSLSLTDLDATAASVVAQGETAGTYGKFSIDASGVWSYATNDAVNQLNAGEVVTEIFSVSTTDGGSASVTVTITGSNDVATITSASAGLTETNAVLSTGGSLSLTDLDATAASVVAQGETAGTYGKFSIDASGVWSYATNDAVNQLNAGEVVTEIFSVSTTDGGSASVTVTITGSNDVATITSASAGLTETNAVLSTGGSLSLTDLDATAASVVAQGETAGTYGKFSIDASGVWSYATNDAVNQLNAGEVVTEIFSVSTTDGGSASVTVTITGSNDVATITSASAGLTETNAVLSTGGSLSLTDLDATAASVVAQGETAGTYGKFSIDASGVWSYATNDAVNQLNAGEVVTEIFSVSTTDGGSASVTVTITGSNDVATITSASAGLTETNAVLSTGGSLSLTDLDATAASVVAQGETAGTYGKFSIDASGVWSYATNDAVNQLNAGEVVTEIFSVSTTDGGSASVTVTITGSNDVATITGSNTGALTEDGSTFVTGGTLSIADADSGETVFTAVAAADLVGTFGSFTFNATTGAWGYTLANSSSAVQSLTEGQNVTDTLTFFSKDGSASETITVTITGVNDGAIVSNHAPVLTGSQASLFAGTEDIAYTVSATQLLAGFTDVEGDSLSITGLSGSDGATVSGPDASGNYTITPALNFSGTVTINYTVSDGQGGNTAASNTVVFAAVNDAPSLTGSQASLAAGKEDTSYIVSAADLLAGFSDVEGDSLSITGLTASNGSIVNNFDGTYTITPAANFNGSLTLNYSVSDGTTATATSNTVVFAAVNDAAVTGGGGNTLGYTENAAAAAINSGLIVTDVDNTTLASATVSITGGYQAGQDVLAFINNNSTTYGDISASWNGAIGVLTLSSATATVTQFQAALRAVTYVNTSDNPNVAVRTVSFQVNDGVATSNITTSTITVTAVNDAAVIATGTTLTGTAVTYTENGAAVAINSGLTVADPDNTTLASATVSITSGYQVGQDVLAFNNNRSASYGNITASWNSTTGILTLTSARATATVAQFQAALRAVTYVNTSDNPNTAARTVSFQVNDGITTSNIATNTITVLAVNDAAVTGGGGNTLGYTENAAAVAINSGLTVADVDNTTLASATVSITGGYQAGQDALAFINNNSATYGDISASWNGTTGVLTLSSATATVAQFQAALRAVTYVNTSDNPNAAARTVSFQVNDGAATSNITTSTITVTAVNDAAVTGGGGNTLGYTENAAAAAINNGLTVADLDNTTLASATVSITGGYQAGQDVLAFINNNSATYGNIVASWDGKKGILTLTSAQATATVAQFQAALRAVTYVNTSDNPNVAVRTVSFQVNDGVAISNITTSTITVMPVNDLPNGTVLITGNAWQGQTLTATNTLADLDGLGAISYQWLRGGNAITGATGSSYVLTTADVASQISVKVIYIDAAGTAEAVTSASTSPIYATIVGTSANNVLSASAASFSTRIEGLAGSDTLTGSGFADDLVGGGGVDRLTGGSGNDRFVYNLLNEGADVITDFASGQDRLAFASSAFSKAAVLVTNATGANDGTTNAQFIYSTSTGVLSYDSNGSKANGLSQIATIYASGTTPVGLAAADISFF